MQDGICNSVSGVNGFSPRSCKRERPLLTEVRG